MEKKYLNENNVILFYSTPFQKNIKLKYNINWNKLDWKYIIHTATSNNVEFHLCKNLLEISQKGIPKNIISKLKKIREIGESEIIKSNVSLKTLRKSFNGSKIPFLVFKYRSTFQFVKDDIDVLVKNQYYFNKAVKNLTGIGYSGYNKKNLAIHFDKENLLQIDLHPHICWDMIGRSGSGFDIIDEQKIWERKRKTTIDGISLYTPSIEDDIIILCTHSIFQHHYITLNEVYHIGELIRTSKDIDWDYIFTSAQKYGWGSILCFMLYIIHQKYFYLYNLSIIPKKSLKYLEENMKNISSRNTTEQIKTNDLCYIFPIILTANIFRYKLYSDYMRRKRSILTLFLQYSVNLLITIFRHLRYHQNKQLSFNLDWLEKHNIYEGL